METYFILLIILAGVAGLLVLYPPTRWLYEYVKDVLDGPSKNMTDRKSSNMSLSGAPAELKRTFERKSTGGSSKRDSGVEHGEAKYNLVTFDNNLITPAVTFIDVGNRNSLPLPLSPSVDTAGDPFRLAASSVRSPLTGASVLSYALDEQDGNPFLDKLLSAGDDNLSNLSF